MTKYFDYLIEEMCGGLEQYQVGLMTRECPKSANWTFKKILTKNAYLKNVQNEFLQGLNSIIKCQNKIQFSHD